MQKCCAHHQASEVMVMVLGIHFFDFDLFFPRSGPNCEPTLKSALKKRGLVRHFLILLTLNQTAPLPSTPFESLRQHISDQQGQNETL